MKIKPYPTKAQLRKLFDYAEGQFVRSGISFTGGLVWRDRVDSMGRPNTREKGSFAGFSHLKSRRLQIEIYGQRYEAGRLVWIWHFGAVRDLIDHQDRDPTNNCISNLRVATSSGNNSNRTAVGGSSKYIGVYLNRRGRWVAQIKKNRQVVYLGTYDSEEEAATARNRATKTLHREFGVLNVIE